MRECMEKEKGMKIGKKYFKIPLDNPFGGC
jgi:hypothetical protein